MRNVQTLMVVVGLLFSLNTNALDNKLSKPAGTGYANAAEGLRVYYEIHGKGEPIVVLAGGFGDIGSMAQTIGPLSRERQVIGIELEGHGHTALRATPMSHERNGDDVAAVLRHLKIARADVAGYSHGGDAAIRMAIQHPKMVRNLIVISTAAARDGWYPEVLKGMEAVSSAQTKQMQQTPLYQQYYAPVAPHPEQFPQLLDRMGALMKKDYDWRKEIAALRVPTLLLFAGHDAVSMRHIAEFFALFDGGVRDAGWEAKPRLARARLAIVPGYTHYNFGMGPDMARVIEAYLDQPTSKATQFQATQFKKVDYAKVNGVNMYYETSGEKSNKPPLLLLHGFHMNIELSFSKLIPELSKDRQVIGVEIQGHGHTADVEGRPFYEAASIVVNCQTQKEIDYFWAKLSEGGEEGPCGWLKDKFGVSWQIVPTILPFMLSSTDTKKSQRVTKAFLQMKKFDIAGLQRAYDAA